MLRWMETGVEAGSRLGPMEDSDTSNAEPSVSATT
jgi:hypothetical protein